jgi:hypothetical protein
MARKDTLLYNVLPAGTSLSASFFSPATVIRYGDNVSYSLAVFTTNSIGTFSVQVSDDYAVSPDNSSIINPGTWITLTLSGIPSVASANDQIGIALNQVPYFAIRLAYTSTTAGTGTVTAYITDKQVGG